MKQRIDYIRVSSTGIQALRELDASVKESGLEPPLLELLKIRASQVNGCAYCLDMHTKVARAHGESEQRLYCLDAWREAPFYTERERAALAWTEAVTLVADGHVPDEMFEAARTQFSEKEMVDLTLAVVTINAWNRLAISFRSTAGTYKVNG